MWWNKLFKPAAKVGHTVHKQEKEPIVLSLADRLRLFCRQDTVDDLYANVVIRRFLITMHYSDIQQLFNALLSDGRSPSLMNAVNIYTYFKTAGTPPSICLDRLSGTLRQAAVIPYGVRQDVEHLITQLSEAYDIYTSQPKDTSP